MTWAALLAGQAGALAVAGAWHALLALEAAGAVAAAARAIEPLRVVRRAGTEPGAADRRRLAVLAAVVLLAGGWLLFGPLAGALLAAGGPWASARLLVFRRERWRAELAAAAAPAARALADALGAGHALPRAVALAARGLPGASGAALQAAGAALAVGAPTDEVLERLAARARDPGWDAIVAAALLQRDAGGDLGGALRAIADRNDEATRLDGDARAATAQARLTARLVLGLPAAALALGELAAPGLLGATLRDPRGLALVLAAVVLQLTAAAIVRWLVRPAA